MVHRDDCPKGQETKLPTRSILPRALPAMPPPRPAPAAVPFAVAIPATAAGAPPFLLADESGVLGVALWAGDRERQVFPSAAADRATLLRSGPPDAVTFLCHALFAAPADAALAAGGSARVRQAPYSVCVHAAAAGLAVLVCASACVLVNADGMPPGTLLCAGRNQYGELGAGDALPRRLFGSVPLPVGTAAADAGVTAGAGFVLTAAGGVAAAGASGEELRPVPLPGEDAGRVAIAIACGYYHAMIVAADGGLLGLGRNRCGELGVGHSDEVAALVDVPRVGLEWEAPPVASAACGCEFTIAVLASGGVIAAGYNGYGALGMGDRAARDSGFVDVPVPASRHIVAASCGLYHALLLDADGTVLAAGGNGYGQLGTGAAAQAAEHFAPVDALTAAGAVAAVSCGYYHPAALTRAGAVDVWLQLVVAPRMACAAIVEMRVDGALNSIPL